MTHTEEEVCLLNKIYEVADTLENFFVSTMKLKCKIKIILVEAVGIEPTSGSTTLRPLHA